MESVVLGRSSLDLTVARILSQASCPLTITIIGNGLIGGRWDLR